MPITSSSASRAELQGLINAITLGSDPERIANPLVHEQWDLLCGYLQVSNLSDGQMVFRQGEVDKTVYFVETGHLSVHYQDAKERVHMALVGSGSIVGEVSFFSYQPRRATVQANGPTRVWLLTALRFSELSKRQPDIALGISMVLGGVLAKRLGNRKRRIAAT